MSKKKCVKCGQETTFDLLKRYSNVKVRVRCKKCLKEYILEKKIKKEVKKKNG